MEFLIIFLSSKYQLTSLVCFYGKHYCVFSKDRQTWVYFSDHVVKEVIYYHRLSLF